MPNPADGGPEHALDAVHPGWRIAGERTGDLFVTHVEGGAFNEPNPLTGNHGGPQTSDNTFIVFSGGEQVRQQSLAAERGPRFDDTLLNPGQAQNVDVAPTVLALFGLAAPRDSEGRVLTEAFSPGALPAPGLIGGRTTRPRPGTTAAAAHERLHAAGRARARPASSRATRPATVDVFQQSAGRRLLGGHLVARFSARGAVRWSGRGNRRRVRDGFLVVRIRSGADVRRFAAAPRAGGFRAARASARAPRARLISRAALSRAGRSRRRRGLTIALRAAPRGAVARPDPSSAGASSAPSPFRGRRPARTYRVRLSGTRAEPAATSSAHRGRGRRRASRPRALRPQAVSQRQSPPKPRAIAAASWRSAPR